MLIKKNKKSTKRGNESRRIRDKGESTFENIDEKMKNIYTRIIQEKNKLLQKKII